MAIEFTAYPRGGQGTGASRRLRHAGKVPGIVYGGSGAPTPVELDHNALYHALKNEAFHSSILTMKLDGAAERVLLRDVQMHAYRPQVLHVDFQRVDENRKIHMKVPLHFVNAEVSPAVKLGGAIVSHVLSELDISCLPRDLPAFIEVDLSNLPVNGSIHVKELALPAGVTPVLRRKGEDPVVATAIVPKGEVVAEEAAAAAAEGAPAAAGAAAPAAASATAPAAAAPAAAAPAAKGKEGKGGKEGKKK